MSYARDVYEEGALIFPCVRIQRDYADVPDIVRMCRARIRVPEMWYGDYLAALGAIRIGERRLHELAERYGAGDARAVRERVVRLLRAAHDGGDPRAAVATVDGVGSPRPARRPSRRDPGAGRRRDRRGGRPGDGRPDRQRRLPAPGAERVRGVRARRGADRRLQLPAGGRAPQRGQLPPRRRADPRRFAGRRADRAALRVGVDDERAQPPDQRDPGRVRRPRAGPRARRGSRRVRAGLRRHLRRRPAHAGARTSTSS